MDPVATPALSGGIGGDDGIEGNRFAVDGSAPEDSGSGGVGRGGKFMLAPRESVFLRIEEKLMF
jgi:hypothetical protein